jgi:hypothetical protein
VHNEKYKNSQSLSNALWVLSLLIEIPIILFFAIILISSLIFWIKKGKYYSNPFIPLLINLLFLIAIIIMPLNFIRNRIGFFINETNYNKAYDLAIRAQPDSAYYDVTLPGKYSSLSDGNVTVINSQNEHAVLFFTLRGVPDGHGGFVRVSNNKNADELIKQLFSEISDKKNLGNNWYYIIGE